MKIKLILFAAIALCTGMMLTGCDNSREKKVEDAKENVDQANKELKDAQAEYDTEYVKFKSEADSKISANQTKIEEFKTEMKTASGKFKAKYEKEVGVLELKNIELRKKISEYKYDGKNNWEDFKRGFNHDLDEVGKTLNGIFAKKN